jgi:predicted metalloprotease with PDZ domain
MKYQFSYQNASRQYIDIEFRAKVKGESTMHIQLPAWRPGRYELGNFAKNIQKWQAFDENDTPLKYKKVTKDLWEIACGQAKEVVVRYNYFAADLNAGSTYLDEQQLYVNPVNCCLYLPNRMDETCELELILPKSYEIASSLKTKKKTKTQIVLGAKDFDELADSPFIASPSLKKLSYKVGKTNFYLWFQGEIKGDEKRLLKDFKAFSEEQGKLFGGFPFEEYHFLFQILPYKAYHGVEHCDSTVICLGPTYDVLKKEKLYDELLGVSSHELFHAWNVKRIRPAEMWPYDFSKENYSRLGYLAEGATTWYGDIMLYRSGAFDENSFLKTFNQLMNRHFNNPGVENLSVADSSFDTWLDGYERGVPNRKSSIYTEGALITFILDTEIRESSKGKYSFDDVMRSFYFDFYLKDKGVTEKDYQSTVERFVGRSMKEFFNKYVNGSKDILPKLKQALERLGYQLEAKRRDNFHESHLGFICEGNKVAMIYPDSAAEKAGLMIEDELIRINGNKLNDDLADWSAFYADREIGLDVDRSKGGSKLIKLQASKALYFANCQIKSLKSLSKDQKSFRASWMKS